jgi:hypothetical protein
MVTTLSDARGSDLNRSSAGGGRNPHLIDLARSAKRLEETMVSAREFSKSPRLMPHGDHTYGESSELHLNYSETPEIHNIHLGVEPNEPYLA